MGFKLYVGNLSVKITSEQLKELFAEFDVESAKIVTDRLTQVSRGFGFVDVTSEDEAKKAVEKIHGTEMEGKAIKVALAKDQSPPK